MSDFVKKGTVKRTTKYTDRQSGEEKNRYVTVGEYWSTDGGNRQAVKIYATLNTDEQWLNIYPLEDDQRSPSHEFNKQVHKDVVLEDIEDKPIDLTDTSIPF